MFGCGMELDILDRAWRDFCSGKFCAEYEIDIILDKLQKICQTKQKT